MRRVIIVVILLVAAAALGLWRSSGGVREGLNRIVQTSGDNNAPGGSNDEIRKTFELRPGAKIEVQGINGSVSIETSDTKTADVLVRRTANTAKSLARREMIVEQTSDGILIRSRQNRTGFWDHLFGKDPKEEVIVKAPRQIALSLRGVNGKVVSGDITGSLEVKGVNGRVDLGQASDSLTISGVNGSIVVGLNQLGEQGARINGVNGGIELRLGTELNADLEAKGMNGSVRSEISEVTVDRAESWSRYSARIGNGGSLIEISGVNGNVRLTRAAGSAPAAASDKGKETRERVVNKAK
jgi:hypothetical protein